MSAEHAPLSRRRLLNAATALGIGAAIGAPSSAHARGRTPVGGRISLRLPWPVTSLDPHRLEDATAAIFGDALFDTLYARDESAAFVPSLADSEPEPEGANLRVRVRAGLRTAKGRAFEPRDAATAIAR